jgi:putative Mg2+ transporter-C (MgtC) family protein
MSLEEQVATILEVLLAALLSMLVGLNRERMGKAAGLRTHMLAGVGACIFTALSIHAFPGDDSSRVASNVVTGIGFLCAGVIWRHETGVHDLTTAASIWATAAIGMAVASGAWLLAIAATVIIWVILALMRYVDMYYGTQRPQPNHPVG